MKRNLCIKSRKGKIYLSRSEYRGLLAREEALIVVLDEMTIRYQIAQSYMSSIFIELNEILIGRDENGGTIREHYTGRCVTLRTEKGMGYINMPIGTLEKIDRT